MGRSKRCSKNVSFHRYICIVCDEVCFACRDTHDEKIRMKDEDIFVAAHVRKIRMLINKYLSTKDGAVEINHVINEMEKINSATIYKLGISSVPQK